MSINRRQPVLAIAAVCLAIGLSGTAHGKEATTPLRSDGWAVELQGWQSHDTSLEDVGAWFAESKYNEQGIAARWEFSSQWFIEGRVTSGRHLRYLLEVTPDQDGAPQFEENYARTRSASFGVGKRLWVNRYFSVRPGISYMWRERDIPQLYSDFDQQREPGLIARDHNLGANVAAEYRVTRRFAVSLNFAMLSSSERAQGIGIAYYFY